MSTPTVTRSCPGLSGKACGQYMAAFELDPHDRCSRCDKRSCSRELPCAICLTWTEEQWTRFEGSHHKSRGKSSRSGSGTPQPTALPPPPFAPLASRVDQMESSISGLHGQMSQILAILTGTVPVADPFLPGFAGEDVSLSASAIL